MADTAEITRDPDFAGDFGHAWRVDKSRMADQRPDAAGTLEGFVVNMPGGHPHWSYWMVALIHLRPIEGQSEPPRKQFPLASHEILFVALDPRVPVPDPDDLPYPVSYLSPAELTYQVPALSDDKARELIDLVVRAIVELGVSPDSDFRGKWAQLIDNTVEHIMTGGHGRRDN